MHDVGASTVVYAVVGRESGAWCGESFGSTCDVDPSIDSETVSVNNSARPFALVLSTPSRKFSVYTFEFETKNIVIELRILCSSARTAHAAP